MAKTFDDFLAAIRQRESSDDYQAVNTLGFLGAYQLGEGPLIDLGFVNNDGNYHDNDYSGGWTGRYGIDSIDEFLNSPDVQDTAAREWFPLVWEYLTNLGADAWLGETVGGIKITVSGLIAGAHLLGSYRVMDWLESGGTAQLNDAYGTPITEYIDRFAGYDMPFYDGALDPADQIIAAAPDAIKPAVETVLADDPDVQIGDDGADDALDGSGNSDAMAGGTGADTLTGYGGRDVLIGGGNDDRLLGGAGRDIMAGGNGADEIRGQRGNDHMLGNGGDDLLGGGAGNDRMFGGFGNDRLFGYTGKDVLNGGQGDDELSGGDGADIFVFADGFGRDTVRDFDPTEGDRVRLGSASQIANYDDLVRRHMHQDGANVVIDAGNGDVLTLENVDLGSLDAGNFLF